MNRSFLKSLMFLLLFSANSEAEDPIEIPNTKNTPIPIIGQASKQLANNM